MAFEWLWLYGFVEPLTGESFFWECSHLDHQCFGYVLETFAQQYPNDMHIIQLDRSAVHRAQKLQVPPNIAFYFQPPDSPELNPIEQLWALLKGRLANRHWCLEELQDALSQQLQQLTPVALRSLMQWHERVEALAWAGMPAFSGGLRRVALQNSIRITQHVNCFGLYHLDLERQPQAINYDVSIATKSSP